MNCSHRTVTTLRVGAPLRSSGLSRGKLPNNCRKWTTKHFRGEYSCTVCEAVRQGQEVVVDVQLEVGPRNSRLVSAGIDVNAPVEVVWGCLTDYEHLADFIPGLTENECLSRRETGAVLRQVGQQDLYLGAKFCATAILDIAEHANGLSSDLCRSISNGNGNGPVWEEGEWFPCPECQYPDLPKDIAFSLIEGDFQAFKGVWRMEGDGSNLSFTRLSYGLFVRPQRWLPVALIQGRIKREVHANLMAVRQYAESKFNRPEP